MLSSFLSFLVPLARQLFIQSINGHNVFVDGSVVAAGNFNSYFFESDHRVKIVLTTLKGDCDIYVVKGRNAPNFDVDGHHLQSTTCGLDIVDVPDNFGSEMTIGIYGHPSHEVSVCHLEVITYDENEDISAYENGSIDINNQQLLDERSRQITMSFLKGHDSSSDDQHFIGDFFENTLKLCLEVLAFILEGLLSVTF